MALTNPQHESVKSLNTFRNTESLHTPMHVKKAMSGSFFPAPKSASTGAADAQVQKLGTREKSSHRDETNKPAGWETEFESVFFASLESKITLGQSDRLEELIIAWLFALLHNDPKLNGTPLRAVSVQTNFATILEEEIHNLRESRLALIQMQAEFFVHESRKIPVNAGPERPQMSVKPHQALPPRVYRRAVGGSEDG